MDHAPVHLLDYLRALKICIAYCSRALVMHTELLKSTCNGSCVHAYWTVQEHLRHTLLIGLLKSTCDAYRAAQEHLQRIRRPCCCG
eukprot:1155208-Pelagomonas_calceolata.AAC.3